jgi:hypothetical protein
MSVKTVIESFAEKLGIGDDELNAMLAEGVAESVDLSQPLPGEAAEAFEVYLPEAGEELANQTKDGLMWYPMIRAGQWAVRPGPKGQKVRRKLKIVEGHSNDSRKELGLSDLLAAFQDEAVENVTVPTSHDNKTLENTGFIRKMKIDDMEVQKGPMKGKKVKALYGGYDFTEPDIKGKVERGTIAGRSCGILYDYTNTETGKTYKSVIEHVALTQKPWITGMVSFGRPLSLSNDLEAEPMTFSDEEPELADDVVDPEQGDEVKAELADPTTQNGSDGSVKWTHEDSPNWMRDQINQQLNQARAEKMKDRPTTPGLYVEDRIPYYRCQEAKPGKALISDGYGDGSNYWVAGFNVNDGNVELEDFENWQAVKNVYVQDDREPPSKDKEPLAEEAHERTVRDDLAEAQKRRRQKTSGEEPEETKQPPRGGEQHMAETSNGTLDLSEEAKSAIQAAEAEAKRLREENERLSERVDRLSTSTQEKDTDAFIDELKSIGFDEEHGFGGFLTAIRNICLADDGEPAVVSESFSEDGKTETGLSVTESFRRVFGAVEKGEDGKIKLGEQLSEPAEKPGEEEGKGGEGAPKERTSDGKPAGAEEEGKELSDEEKRERAQKKADEFAEDPAFAGVIGAPKAKTDEKKDGGESS